MKPRPRQIHQVALEVAKRLRHFERLLRRFQHVVRTGVFDKDVGTPDLAALIGHAGLIGESAQQPDRPLAGFGLAGVDLRQQMAGDPVHVLHHLLRLAEHIPVDPLKDVMQPHPPLIEGELKGVVDMAAAEGNRNQKIAVECEFRTDAPEIILRVHQ